MLTANDWVQRLDLSPHPEGGFYRQTYRAAEAIPHAALPARFTGARAHSTAIFFLLRSQDISALHRIRADELWHFYAGSAVTVHMIEPDGTYRTLRLGSDPEAGEAFQGVVPVGCTFGAAVDAPDSYALVGCTVAPGFDFEDFEQPSRSALLAQFPQHRALIERLTREV